MMLRAIEIVSLNIHVYTFSTQRNILSKGFLLEKFNKRKQKIDNFEII